MAAVWANPVDPSVGVDIFNSPTKGWLAVGNFCPGLCIADATFDGQGDAYDGAAWLHVGGVSYAASNPSDYFNLVYTGGVASMSGLNVSMQYYTFVGLVRVMVVFSNPGTSAISTDFSFETDSGADGGMQIISTGSGDNLFTTADGFVVVDDGDTAGGDPATSFLLFSPGAANTPTGAFTTTSLGGSGIRSDFNLTVSPGQTSRFLFFLGLNSTAAEAAASTAFLAGIPGALTSGMSFEELTEVQNFNVANVPEPGTLAQCAAGAALVLLLRRRPRR